MTLDNILIAIASAILFLAAACFEQLWAVIPFVIIIVSMIIREKREIRERIDKEEQEDISKM